MNRCYWVHFGCGKMLQCVWTTANTIGSSKLINFFHCHKWSRNDGGSVSMYYHQWIEGKHKHDNGEFVTFVFCLFINMEWKPTTPRDTRLCDHFEWVFIARKTYAIENRLKFAIQKSIARLLAMAVVVCYRGHCTRQTNTRFIVRFVVVHTPDCFTLNEYFCAHVIYRCNMLT